MSLEDLIAASNRAKHDEYIKERRKKASQAFFSAIEDLLELLREDVSGIVATVQVMSAQRSNTNRQLIDELKADKAALENKVEVLRLELEALKAKHVELNELVLSALGEA